MSTPQYRIKNWHKFQHFKDRRPPWIKLYRDILDDIEWHRLQPDHAKALIALWLIASECDGCLPDIETLAFRLRTAEKAVNSHLAALSHWLEHDDIAPISPRYHGDAPEERREETEKETEKETKDARRLAGLLADSILSWKPDMGQIANGKRDAWVKRASADIDKMIRLDARTPENIESVIRWLPSHVGSNGFTWRANVLSGKKLREQYDKLDIAMQTPAANGGGRRRVTLEELGIQP